MFTSCWRIILLRERGSTSTWLRFQIFFFGYLAFGKNAKSFAVTFCFRNVCLYYIPLNSFEIGKLFMLIMCIYNFRMLCCVSKIPASINIFTTDFLFQKMIHSGSPVVSNLQPQRMRHYQLTTHITNSKGERIPVERFRCVERTSRLNGTDKIAPRTLR